ncbi:MAG: hypothetical protein OEQ39_04465 [Gammaproteobacteria bacterium]|nr:hypothetical protein [Gammaproteobacteria bacterium]
MDDLLLDGLTDEEIRALAIACRRFCRQTPHPGLKTPLAKLIQEHNRITRAAYNRQDAAA